VWAREGQVRTTPGRTVGLDFVAHELFSTCNIQRVIRGTLPATGRRTRSGPHTDQWYEAAVRGGLVEWADFYKTARWRWLRRLQLRR
jgi:hypothetical protein